ncbi:MAG: alginate export family protein [Gammaproteobacteria bacterium]
MGSITIEGRGEVSIRVRDGFKLHAGVEGGVGYFHTVNTRFGSGREDVRSGKNTGDAQWAEGYVEPALDAVLETATIGNLYGGVSAVGVLTEGEGDAAGYTNDGDDGLDLEHLFLGWHSGTRFAGALGEDGLDLSYGRQEFRIGDGFLIYDGDLDQFDKGAAWLSPRASYERAAVLKVGIAPLRGDVFYLRADGDQDNTELIGGNLEHRIGQAGQVGLTYLHVFGSTPLNWGARAGMNVINLRANGIAYPEIPNLTVWAEYVKQLGAGKDGRIDAEAWYAEGRYRFSEWPWMPSIAYRYAYFSGDSRPGDGTQGEYDPLFYGWSRGWGSWYQGEITGEWLLFNGNQVNHMVHLTAYPRADLGLGIIYYDFDLDENRYFGTPVSDQEFTQELNAYADWSLTDQVSLSALYGVAFPGTAAEQAFGGERAYHVVEGYVSVSF